MILQAVIALAVALADGASAVRAPDPATVAPEVYEAGPAVILTYTVPGRCPSFEDEPCYVIVGPGLAVETGP